MTVFCGVLLFLSVILTRLVFRGRLMNPLLAFFPAYSMLLACYHLGLRRGLFTLSVEAPARWFLMGAMFAFFLGVITVAGLNKTPEPQTKRAHFEDADFILAEKMALYGLIAYAGVVAYKYLILEKSYGNFFNDIGDLRIAYVAGTLRQEYGPANSLAFFLQTYLALNIGTLLGIRPTTKTKIIAISMAVCEILNDMTIGGAWWTFLTLMLMSIAAVCSYEVISDARMGWKQIKVVLIAGILMCSCAMAIFEVRGKGNLLSVGAAPEDVVLWYNGGDISTFQYFYEHPIPSIPPGRHLLGGIYSLADKAAGLTGFSCLAELDPFNYIAFIPMANNTSIYLSYIYSDVGIVGSIIVTFVMGAISTYVYFRAVRLGRILDVQLQALLLFGVFISIRSVVTQGDYFWILLLGLYLQHKLATSIDRLKGRASVPSLSVTVRG
jgi:oligosaccharide repeat unit polymerase